MNEKEEKVFILLPNVFFGRLSNSSWINAEFHSLAYFLKPRLLELSIHVNVSQITIFFTELFYLRIEKTVYAKYPPETHVCSNLFCGTLIVR